MSEQNKTRVGVVLSGGGSRGAFQAGALAALGRYKLIEESVVVYSGVSVGALNAAACAYKGMQGVSDIWEDLTKEDIYREYGMIRSIVRFLRHGGPRSSGPLRKIIEEVTLDTLKTDFTCGSVNIDDGLYHEFHSKDGLGYVVDNLVASASIPGVVPPVIINGNRHWDGGLRNPTPIGQALKYDVDYLIVIGTEPAGTQPMKRLSKDVGGIDMIKRGISTMVEEGFESDLREFELKNKVRRYKHVPYEYIFPMQSLGSGDDFGDYARREAYGYNAADFLCADIMHTIRRISDKKAKAEKE